MNEVDIASPTSQLILKPFRRFTYVTARSTILPSLHLRRRHFTYDVDTSPTSQLILQLFHRFTYVTIHSPTLPLLHLRHSSFSKPSFASPTSQLILQPFHCVTYVTAHTSTLPPLYLHHSSFSNPSIALPMSQLNLKPFFRFSYVTGFSLTSPGEPPMYTYCWNCSLFTVTHCWYNLMKLLLTFASSSHWLANHSFIVFKFIYCIWDFCINHSFKQYFFSGVCIPLKHFANFIGKKHTFSQFWNWCLTNY